MDDIKSMFEQIEDSGVMNDLLMFLFFNNTTKTKTNGEIFNKFATQTPTTADP